MALFFCCIDTNKINVIPSTNPLDQCEILSEEAPVGSYTYSVANLPLYWPSNGSRCAAKNALMSTALGATYTMSWAAAEATGSCGTVEGAAADASEDAAGDAAAGAAEGAAADASEDAAAGAAADAASLLLITST